MGNGSSLDVSRAIYVEINGKAEKIVFSRSCGTRDIIDLLNQSAGMTKLAQVTLKDQDGALVTISPSMPSNSQANPYKASFKEDKRRKEEVTPVPQSSANNTKKDTEMLQSVLTHVAEQFNKSLSSAFRAEETQHKFVSRLNELERKIEVEGLKVVEIERCKKDIHDLKNQLYTAHKKMVDYNKLSSITEPEDGVKLKVKAVPTFQKYTLSQETIDYLKQPTFDIWHWEPNEMLSLLEHMYHELGLVDEFNINPITLKRWLLCVQENYRNNPFHNFRHCFCVTQMMYGMIQLCHLWENMSREDLGILITACVCHDLDHPGYNNTYQINARTELAIRYNDISPLENHHCAVAFQILSNPETNIFGNVDSTTFKRIRSEIRNLILATDMARHSDITDKFREYIKDFDYNNKDHVDTLKMVLIKCCDISNEVRPFEVSEPWVDCLLEEYFNQSDREKEEGLPVAPFMDREKVTKPTAQIGFIKFVLIPMFETVASLFTQLEPVMVAPLKGARDRYEEMRKA